MRAKSFADMTCSVAGALEAIGDRWAVLLLRDLSLGLSKYDELQASTGMPTTTLSTRLKHLESTGLVERRPYQDNPPRHEYRLTDKGRDLWKVTTALREWGDRWDTNGLGAPTIELIDGQTGHPLVLALVDAETGAPVPRERARLRPGPAAAPGLKKLLGGNS
ncbi:MAG: transcriptional regulator [Phenylobacterium sp.]|uniref:winged helix-turn-helix transcriptional regulator n=1 Tax=Phenylobacterium sp. TaxID=1871053 RepID=UPI0025E87960|nr:helix-turn-helix domain-containing protein [Phenylobacterium sp.]MBA4011367.1 transcriptional regulator [Phenylobacterium sp.]